MGYESRIYVVRKNEYYSKNENGLTYAENLAMFEMCKCYGLSDILREKPKTDCYIYSDDGNTEIIEDCYGSYLTEAPIKDAIEILKKVISEDKYGYWRYDMLLHSLRAIYESSGYDNNIYILHYGY